MSSEAGSTGVLRRTRVRVCLVAGLTLLAALPLALSVKLQAVRPLTVTDPGPRGGAAGAGGAWSGLNSPEMTVFTDGQTNFEETRDVQGTITGNLGLGPLFNSNQCSSCHAQPAAGGASPLPTTPTACSGIAGNPLFCVYNLDGATNMMPSFESSSGPALVARFPFIPDSTTPDNTVHQLFTITGRTDATSSVGTCSIAQPNFMQAQSQNNIAFRQPIETFGDGTLEILEDSVLAANMSNVCGSTQFGSICGTPNISQHDGSINRFGWKAQWRSLYLATSEEENVQEGVTNEFYPNELNETAGCVFNPVPEDGTNFNPNINFDQFTGTPERMAIFMLFTAGPAPVNTSSGTFTTGQSEFIDIGCAQCHTVSYTTTYSTYPPLSQRTVTPYSDLLLHHMGPCLADNIVQAKAQGDMFRTPPLWGIGQRMWFMHDGRTSNLITAINDHFCAANSQYQASEANTVINNYNALSPTLQQDIITFLRDL
jgi:CxxC motif-containing protein (DUF1111 family)